MRKIILISFILFLAIVSFSQNSRCNKNEIYSTIITAYLQNFEDTIGTVFLINEYEAYPYWDIEGFKENYLDPSYLFRLSDKDEINKLIQIEGTTILGIDTFLVEKLLDVIVKMDTVSNEEKFDTEQIQLPYKTISVNKRYYLAKYKKSRWKKLEEKHSKKICFVALSDVVFTENSDFCMFSISVYTSVSCTTGATVNLLVDLREAPKIAFVLLLFRKYHFQTKSKPNESFRTI